MRRAVPPAPGGDRPQWRGAFALTEPLPYVGVGTSLLSGKVRVAEWAEGREPVLQVDKRGRFITNMGFANFVAAAVDSADPRIKGSCMVILEETGSGTFDRGAPTRKLVHQLSSTADPVFSLRVPASRIVGGNTVKGGVIVPRYSRGEVIEAVFRRTRVTVGLMTSAKLLSAVEPIIRYQRGRFRGGGSVAPGSPRYELGLQQREDTLHRLVDVWATGEAGASLGFAAARPAGERDAARYAALESDLSAVARAGPLVRFLVLDSLANVLCPAVKLWNTGHGATMMREAVSLMGGYGITEDCPGLLGHKWMDAQLEATYEGPEAVQGRQLTVTMTNELFLEQFRLWIAEMRRIASGRPGTGASTLATAMELWLWTLNHLLAATDADGAKLRHGTRQGVTFPLADALCWLLASRCQILDVLEVQAKGPENPVVAGGLAGLLAFLAGLPPQVVCYERADDTAFGVSGVVTRARGIRATFPDLAPAEIPLAAPVGEERLLSLLDPHGASRRSATLRLADRLIRAFRFALPCERDALHLPYIPPFLRKDGGLLLSIGQFTQWVGAKVMAAGLVQVWPGTPVASPLIEADRVVGVRWIDQGADRRGNPEAGFMPGWMSAPPSPWW